MVGGSVRCGEVSAREPFGVVPLTVAVAGVKHPSWRQVHYITALFKFMFKFQSKEAEVRRPIEDIIAYAMHYAYPSL